MNNEDERCCGSGHCIVNADGQCWCGQQWDGEKMCQPKLKALADFKAVSPAAKPTATGSTDSEIQGSKS